MRLSVDLWEEFSRYLFSEVKLSKANQGEVLLRSRYKLICNFFGTREFNKKNFVAFISSMQDRGCTGAYMNNVIKVAKHLNAFLKEYYSYDANIDKFTYFERERNKFDIFTMEEVKAISALDYPYERMREYKNHKFRTIFRLLPETGIRRLELLELKWIDVLTNKTIRVGVKNKTERFVPISDSLYDQIMSLPKSSVYVFSSEKEARKDCMMGITVIGEDLALRKKHLGIISPDKSVHKYRHFFATDLLRNGAPLKHIQWLLGHKSVASTETYLQYVTEELRETVMTYSSLQQGHETFFAICDKIISLVHKISRNKISITIEKDVNKKKLAIILTE